MQAATPKRRAALAAQEVIPTAYALDGQVDPDCLTRREREHRFRMDLVLDAAWEVFAEKTLSRATVSDIAQRAEISIGTFYKLFRGKDEIFRHLVEREQARFFSMVKGRVDQCATPTAKIHELQTVLFELFSLVLDQLRVYVSDTDAVQWEVKDQLSGQVRNTSRVFISYVAEICREGLEAGEFRAGLSPDLVAANIMTISDTFVAHALDSGAGDVLGSLEDALVLGDRMLGIDSTRR